MSKLKGMDALRQKAQASTEALRQTDAERSPMQLLNLDALVPSPYQARKDFSTVNELAEDIRQHGVLQPVLVRPLGQGRYELVAGERRWRAAQVAGRTDIPAVIRRMTDQEAQIFGLTENLQREDLNAYELARVVVELVAAKNELDPKNVVRQLQQARPPEALLRTADETLHLLGKKMSLKTYVRHYLPLLSLPNPLVQAIEQGASYAAVAALRQASPQQRTAWLPKVVSGEWGVRDVKAALAADRKPAVIQEPPAGEWTEQLHALTEQATAQNLSALDGRKQRRARRLLQELMELFGES